jgi:predicted lipoprotein
MAIEMTLTGTRSDLVEHLQSKATERKAAARSMSKDAAAKQLGIAEGLEEAAGDLERWREPDEVQHRAMSPGHLRPLERDGQPAL